MLKLHSLAILGLLSVSVTANAFAAKAVGDKPADAANVWITRSDGALSCSPNSGSSLEDGAADLRKAKVRVLESRKGTDGKMHVQMCGAPSGSTNSFLIPKEDLPTAVARGYVEAR